MSTLFFSNPRLTFLTIMMIVIAGVSAFLVIPRQEDPTLTELQASLIVHFPGANAKRVEALVTEKLETALLEISDIKEIKSRSRTGLSAIDIILDDSVTDTEVVWAKVRGKLSDAKETFPDGVGTTELTVLVTSAYTFLAGISWTQDSEPQLDILYRLAKEFEQQLSSLPGTREVKIFGKVDEEVLVTVQPTRMSRVGLAATDVAAKIANADTKTPAGQVRGPHRNLSINMAGELNSVERVRQISLQIDDDGKVLKVGDIATVERKLNTPLGSIALVNGVSGMVIGARIKDNLRVHLWSNDTKRLFEEFAKTLPTGISATVIFDQSHYTEKRLGELATNLLIGAGAVFVVLFLMMGWRSSILVSLALPLSIAMVLASLKFLDITLHQISVVGLIIALGLLIDNAIISVDEYRKHRLEGHSPRNAIKETVDYLWIPLSASTITTALAFMPLVIMPGPTGEFVGTLGVAVILSIIASLALSLTVIPALAGYLDTWFPASPSTGFLRNGISTPRLRFHYQRLLRLIIGRPYIGIMISLILPFFGFFLSAELIQQFFPPADRNQFQVQISLPSTASLTETRHAVERARKIIHQHQEVRDSHWFIGENPPRVYYNTVVKQAGNANFSQAFVNTGSAAETASLVPRLQHQLMRAFPNAIALALPYEQGPPFEAPIEVQIFGQNLDILRQLGEELRQILAQTNHVTYTQATVTGGRPELKLVPDADKINFAGLQLADVAQWLSANMEGVTGGTVLEDTEELPIRVRVGGINRSDLSQVFRGFELPVRRMSDGKSTKEARANGLPLSAVTSLTLEPTIDTINRYDGKRVNVVQAFLIPYTLPQSSIVDFKERLAASDFKLPPGYQLSYGGESKETAEAQDGLLSSLIPLLFIMAAIIVLAFNSFRMAGIIGLVAVFSIGLALLALWLFNLPLGFMAIVGTMGLVGLAINDSIVVLTALRGNAKSMQADSEAIVDVVTDATRHIISTTLTTLGGFMPLIIWGGNFWPPLAIAVAGGMVGATLLALIFVPAMFIRSTRRSIRREERTTALSK